MNSNQLTSIDQVVSMTSLEIAELTGKRHKNVLRDCEKLTEVTGLKNELSEINYTDPTGRELKAYRLTKKATFVLTAGYSAELRLKCYERIELLESQVKRLEDVQKRAAIQSANRRGVTWGDFCKTNGLSAQKVLKALVASKTVIQIRASGEVLINPKYSDCFRVIKPTDRRFTRSGLNFRFTAKGLERFSSPKAKAKLIEHYMKLGNPTAKEYREWCQTRIG
ncbi:Rha family transcriptional regulator [Escherichia coli]|nr:Rha family transcriptional regulator [Escherichia coli]